MLYLYRVLRDKYYREDSPSHLDNMLRRQSCVDLMTLIITNYGC